METITGTVSRIIFRNEENCYTVFLFEADEDNQRHRNIF